MHILLLASAFNSLTQRVQAELRDRGHSLAVQLVHEDGPVREAVRQERPDLVVAPYLKSAIPDDVWSVHTCLIVHPGPVGDRGPSSLDWAVHEGADNWGVTVLQANAEMDAGDVWASASCSLPPVGKSDLYRNEISDAAVEAVLLAVGRFASGTYTPTPQTPGAGCRPLFRQSLRRIDWQSDSTATVVRKLRAADSQPGVLDELLGGEWFLHGGHPEPRLGGRPGALVATRDGAICRATTDGAVWIPELRPRRAPGGPATFKLPATSALAGRLSAVPERPAPLHRTGHDDTWSEISYREEAGTGFLSFSFRGGAMSTEQCQRLLHAYRFACSRPTSVLVIGGGRDFFSNGIHLNVIEASADPGAESWANINAMDDLVEAVLTTTDRLVVSAMAGNAAAGGVMLALAADEVWCRAGAVLNPHYRLMGLYGSEYWTYTLPRRVGAAAADRLVQDALPVSSAAAHRLGLIDRVIACAPRSFDSEVGALASRLAALPATRSRINAKKAERDRADLAAFREAELIRMQRIFADPHHPYHGLRRAFVRKERPASGAAAQHSPLSRG
ncbi:hydrogenase maturation protein [Streptomyces sp. NBC_01387]|uniref:hydrogenase maturation protein n=1 Tax=unclassified Streptomyces TaxID=2593676 RepID=UPI002DDA0978|nr:MULTISPECIES: hydrogenase maturation protein [unclassified Streptomyces]WSC24377.1 hydrogenase maturation protein [Streptomyces sp. NBC_01766]WSV58261.1 hydrogenase maturation protein [Streptomyces sp. NBC_01014]